MSDRDTLFKTYTLAEVMKRCERFCGSPRGDALQQMRDWVNDVIANIMDATSHRFMLESSGFNTALKYDTGTAAVTKGSTSVTITGATLTTSHIGRKFYVTSHAVGYPITAASGTALTLAWPWMKDTASGVSYRIVKDTYGLASDFDRAKIVDQHYTNLRLLVLESLPRDFSVSDRPRICQILDSDPADGSTLMALRMHPAPEKVMRISYDYYRKYTELTSDSTTVPIPDQFVLAICFGVAELYWLTQGDSRASLSKADKFRARYENAVVDMIASKYRDNAKLVQFVPYDQPGITNQAGEHGDWDPADLI